MDSELQDLARRIGATGFTAPGMAFRHPETGRLYRATDGGMWTVDGKNCPLATGRAKLDAAIAAGPDLTDAATLGVLLGDDGLVEPIGFADYRADVGKAYAHGMDRTTAIARAWIAAHAKEKANV